MLTTRSYTSQIQEPPQERGLRPTGGRQSRIYPDERMTSLYRYPSRRRAERRHMSPPVGRSASCACQLFLALFISRWLVLAHGQRTAAPRRAAPRPPGPATHLPPRQNVSRMLHRGDVRRTREDADPRAELVPHQTMFAHGIGRGITRPAGPMEPRAGDHRPDGASLRLDLPARHAGRAIRPAGPTYPVTH